MEFIGYPKCSTCKKALKHLKEKGYDIEMRDIVSMTPTAKELSQWIDIYDQGIKPFFNTSGNVYKEMKLKDRINSLTKEEAVDLLSKNGMLIKRPLLILEDEIIIGYKAEIYEQL